MMGAILILLQMSQSEKKKEPAIRVVTTFSRGIQN